MQISVFTDAVGGASCHSVDVMEMALTQTSIRMMKETLTMTGEQNKAIVRRFYEAFMANDQQRLNDVLAPSLTAYSHGSPDPQNRGDHIQGISGWNASFETRFTIDEQIAEGDAVATQVTMRAVHNRGAFMDVAPTGREAVSTAISIERIVDGRIVERRVGADWSAIMHQLGLVPAPQPSH